MCGILGAFGALAGSVATQDFEEALELLAHRGPDGSGVHRGGGFILGHRRLSIIDLSREAGQPMLSPEGTVAVTFNGEVYNYRELAEELRASGVKLSTSSDTEVVLQSYLLWGTRCFERFNGMFAIGIHDARTNTLYLARDRLGIKPLFVHERSDGVAFSSEPKAILRLFPDAATLNPDALISYFSFRHPIVGGSFFQKIRTVEPGHVLEISGSTVRERCFWDPIAQISEQNEDRGEAWYINELRRLLERSVAYRMIADVPVGAFLSGGVDSSAVACIMGERSSHPVKTFTVGFRGTKHNEFDYAHIAALKARSDHHEILLTADDYLSTMEALIRKKDAPLAVPNEVPLHLMSVELRRHVTVVLSGEGADELFGGYGRLFRSTDEPAAYRRIVAEKDNSPEARAFVAALQAKYGLAALDDDFSHFMAGYRYTPELTQRQLLRENVANDEAFGRLNSQLRSSFDAPASGTPYLARVMWVFQRWHLLGLLQRLDNATMAASVEGRVPFVDHELVEFGLSIPLHHKLRWNSPAAAAQGRYSLGSDSSEVLDTPKYILKKALEDRLPPEILYRRKVGFPVPLNEWFGGKFRDVAAERLLDPNARINEFTRPESVRALLDRPDLAAEHSVAMRVWMLLNLEIFLTAYLP